MAQFEISHKKSLIAETNAEIVANRKKTRKRRFWLFFILFFVFLGSLVYFSWHKKLLIKNVYLDGNRVLSENKLSNAVYEYLGGRFLFIFPNKNAFIFSESDLKDFLFKKYPVIKDIEVRQNIPNDLFISVYEREPYALWCSVLPVDCVFIDTTGYAYEKAPYFSRPLFLVYELPGAEVTKRVLDEASFLFAEEIQKRLTLDGDIVQKISPKGEGVFEFSVVLPNKVSKTLITTSIDIGADETVNRIRTLLVSDDVKNNSSRTLKTIDVRFGNQVIYTFY